MPRVNTNREIAGTHRSICHRVAGGSDDQQSEDKGPVAFCRALHGWYYRDGAEITTASPIDADHRLAAESQFTAISSNPEEFS
jgi:hypothetical protein